MLQKSSPLVPLAIAALALILFVIVGLVGGPNFMTDIDAIHSLAADRFARAGLTNGAVMLTQLGNAEGLFAILLLAAAFLAKAARWRDLMAMVGIVIGGRIAVEALKLLVDRPRPSFTDYPVEVHSLSFPSGHAGNSMITFLAIALIAVPTRWRGRAVVMAILGSVAIGLTRPYLGVHWPSDVIGGWMFGIGWVVALSALTRRWRETAKQ